MFKLIAETINHFFSIRKMRRFIILALESMYSENLDFDCIEERLCVGGNAQRLQGYIAIRIAVGLTEPLTSEDVLNGISELKSSLKHEYFDSFEEIISRNRSIAEMKWLRCQLKIAKGKAAFDVNEYSIEGMIYGMQKSLKSPISKDQKNIIFKHSENIANARARVKQLESQNTDPLSGDDHQSDWNVQDFLRKYEQELDSYEESKIDSEIIAAENYLNNIIFSELDGKNEDPSEIDFEPEVDEDDPHVLFTLATMYYDGDGIEKNLDIAVNLLQKAAEKGHLKAQHNLAFMYETGEGVKRDYVQAVKWYEISAKNGNYGSMNNLGSLYETGCGVKKDVKKALELYVLALKGGDENARSNVQRLRRNSAR